MSDLRSKQREMQADMSRVRAIHRRLETVAKNRAKLAEEAADLLNEAEAIDRKWNVVKSET